LFSFVLIKESDLWFLDHYLKRNQFPSQNSFPSKACGKPKAAGGFSSFCCLRKGMGKRAKHCKFLQTFAKNFKNLCKVTNMLISLYMVVTSQWIYAYITVLLWIWVAEGC
jgi:hypothetical protein